MFVRLNWLEAVGFPETIQTYVIFWVRTHRISVQKVVFDVDEQPRPCVRVRQATFTSSLLWYKI